MIKKKSNAKKTAKQLKRKLWDLFSVFIRQRDSDWRGNCVCISCGRTLHWKQMDAGHFVPKSKGNYYYFLEENVHAQCGGCNRFGSNDTGYNFGRNLEAKIGKSRVDRLRRRQKSKQYTAREYEDLIIHYKEKIKNLVI